MHKPALLGVLQLSQRISHKWPVEVGQSPAGYAEPAYWNWYILRQRSGTIANKPPKPSFLAGDLWWQIIIWNGAWQQTRSFTYSPNNPML